MVVKPGGGPGNVVRRFPGRKLDILAVPAVPGKLTEAAIERAETAFSQYVGLGDERSLIRLCQVYGYSRGTVNKWCGKYKWSARIAAISENSAEKRDEILAKLHAEHQAKKFEYFNVGFALDYERVAALNALAHEIYVDLTSNGVVVEGRVRSEPIRVFRELLGDIAAEKSERQKNVRVLDEGDLERKAKEAGVDPERVKEYVRSIKKDMQARAV